MANQSANNKRSSKISTLKRKNTKLYSDSMLYLKHNKIEHEEQIRKYFEGLNKCAGLSLYEISTENRYIGSHTCKKKVCAICNYQRLKQVRYSYQSFFEKNVVVFVLEKTKKRESIRKNVVSSNLEKEIEKGFVKIAEVKYDLFHLTLTVPHTKETGWRGDIYYFKPFIAAMKALFEIKEIKNFILGGEYGIEVTNFDGRDNRPDSGLHIHSHCLLMVKRSTQNLNILRRLILKHWNQLTIDPNANRKEFSENDLRGLLKTSGVTMEFIKKELNPNGATLIGLNSVYYHSMDPVDKKLKKHYITCAELDAKEPMIIKAILETIKYHFEPMCFNKKDDDFNVALLIELIPILYRIKLHEKFGCLYGVKELNIQQDAKEAFDEHKNKENLEEVNFSDFIITNPLNVIHDWKKDNKIIIPKHILEKSKVLRSTTTTSAVECFGAMIKVANK